jgi:AcrR family transcriptional regulator
MKKPKPSIRMPVQTRALEKRKSILKAALKLVGEKGYAKVDTVAIAREADISVGTLYAYFNNKREIFLEASRQYHQEVMTCLEASVPQTQASPDLEMEIRSLLGALVSINREYRFFQKEFVALSFSDEEVKELYHARRMEMVAFLMSRLSVVCGEGRPTRVGLYMSVCFLQDLFYQVDSFPEYGFDRELAIRLAEKTVANLLLSGANLPSNS